MGPSSACAVTGAYEAIPGTGHLLQIQKPEECRRAMLEFLDEQGIRY